MVAIKMVLEDTKRFIPITVEVIAPINNLYWSKHQGGITEEDSAVLREFKLILEKKYGCKLATKYVAGQHIITELLIVDEAKYNWFLLKWG